MNFYYFIISVLIHFIAIYTFYYKFYYKLFQNQRIILYNFFMLYMGNEKNNMQKFYIV